MPCGTLKRLIRSLSLFIPLTLFAHNHYAPIIVGDIITFVPYSHVSVSLGDAKTIRQDESCVLHPEIEHPEEVASYRWSEGDRVLGTEAALSTAGLSVGSHTLTLTVTDTNGVEVSSSIVITIDDPIDEGEFAQSEVFAGTTKGEFTVVQGAAHYSLKIDVPPGVAGMEPKLSLNYSSSGANGYLGLGWSLAGASAVTRCPQSRAVEGSSHAFGVKYNSDDRFCLDGQRLIAVQGAYGADGTEYRTEIDRYSKIISHGNYYGGPRYFEVHTKSGLTYYYGWAEDIYVYTRLYRPLKAWKVDRIYDSYNNKITFKYHSDYTKGIHYLEKILYADNSVEFHYQSRIDKLRSYHEGLPESIEKRLHEIIVKTGRQEVRRYKIDYTNDPTGSHRSILSAITEILPDEGALKTLAFLGEDLHANALFSYTDAYTTGILSNGSDSYGNNDADNKWYLYTPDINGDGLSDICYRADTGIKCFVNHHGTFSDTAEIDTAICANGDTDHGVCNDRDNYKTIRFVDMDADGLADLMYRSDNGIRIWKSTGAGFLPLSGNTILANGTPSSSENNWKYLYTPDINGDGRLDICYRADTGIKCFVNHAGAYFSTTPTIDTSICANNSSAFGGCNSEDNYATIRFVDLNGDGLQDLFYRSDEGVRIWESTGHGFGSSPVYESELIKDTPYTTVVSISANRDEWKYIYTPDMNGDGLADLCYRSYEGIKCYTNYGGRFAATPSIDTAICAENSHENGTCNDEDNYKTIQFVDTDADGLVDLTYRSDAGMRIWKNRGNTLSMTPLGSSILANYRDDFGNNDYDNWNTKGYFDFNGDGIQDLYYRSDDSGIVIYTNRSKHALLRHILNDTDESIKIDYKPLTDPSVYHNYSLHGKRNGYGFNNIANGNIEITPALPVVSSVKTLNGLGDDIYAPDAYNTIRYKYYGFVLNKLRGLQGFHAINTYDDTAHMYTTTLYKQIGMVRSADDTDSFAFTGMPYEILAAREYGVNTPLSLTTIDYKDASTRAKIAEPYAYRTTTVAYDPDDHIKLSTTTTTKTLSSDGLGNVLNTAEMIEDHINDIIKSKSTSNHYDAEDTAKWYIGRLTAAAVTHRKTDQDDIIRRSEFTYNAKGLLSKEVANAGTPLALTKSYSYDAHGNKIKEIISGSDITTATTTYGYDSLGKFQTSMTDAAGYTIHKSYNHRFGTVTSLTDANDLTTTWEYDGLGRKIAQRDPDGTLTRWRHTYGANVIGAAHVCYSVAVSSDAAPFKRIYYDNLGREVGSYSYTMRKGSRQSYSSRRIMQRKYYNAKGELTKEELPHYQGEAAGTIENTYDKYGRLTKVTKTGPDNTTQSYSYSYGGFSVTVTNPKGVAKRTTKNAFDETIKVTDAYGTSLASSISYDYDAAGNLLSTTDAAGNKIAMAYDTAGNKISMHDPDLGEWHYSYNALGKLTKQWSGADGYANSKHASYKNYDILGRVTREMSYNRPEYNANTTTYSYNQTDYRYGSPTAVKGSRGKLLQTVSSSRMKGSATHRQTITYRYDALGRETGTTTTILGRGDYTTATTYDRYSRPSKITYPNGYTITRHYQNALLDKIIGSDGKVHYEIDSLSPFGEVEDARFGNGVRSVAGYDSAGYLLSLSSQSYGHFNDVQQIHYSYDSMGNVIERVDGSIPGKSITDTYSYDAMDRLSATQTTSDVAGSYTRAESYRYDKLGNITYRTGIGSYSYYATKPHAVKSAGSRSYSYDAVGNATHRNGDTITYNPLNKPATLTNHTNNQSVTFVYGANKQRYMKYTSEGKQTYYIGKAYEEQVADNTQKQICYITLGSKTIGTHVEIKDTDYVPTNPHYNEASYNRYFHTDALGSITAITDDAGVVVERRSYDAFGKIRAMDYGTNHNTLADITLQTTRAFTGHEQIAELPGLIHMNARVYDSEIGRFLSADTTIQDPYDSQAYNRYSYVRNNPLKYSDPTGHSWFSKLWEKIKPYVIGAVVAVIAAYTGGAVLMSITQTSSIAAATSAATLSQMAVAGAVGGFAAGVSGGLLNGAGLGDSIAMGMQGAAYGAIGAAAAGYIGGIKSGMIRASLHGITRAAIAKAQGGRYSGGFWSGFASSLLSPLASSASTFEGKIAMSAIVGGTAAELGGGKFANGAVTAAFVMMYNEMGHPRTLSALTPAQQRAMYARMQEPGLVDVSEIFVPVVRTLGTIGKFFGIGVQTEALSVEMVDITARKSRYTNYSINVSANEARYNLEMNGYITNDGIGYVNGGSSYSFYIRSSSGNSGMMFKAGNRRIKYDLLGE